MKKLNADWIKMLCKQLIKMVVLMFGTTLLAFFLLSISPIDPVDAYVNGQGAVSEEQKLLIEERWGVNDPPVQRYATWLGNILKGDMGESITYRLPVAKILQERFVQSIVLMSLAWVLSGIVGFAFGIIAAIYRGRWVDKLIKSYCLLVSASPTFWIGLVFLLIFAVQLDWFPLGMAVPVGKLASEVTILERIHRMILPVVVLSFTGVSHLALHTREQMIEVLQSEHALFSRSRGQSIAYFVRRHGLRNALMPALTVHFAGFSELFGGSVLVETVFSYPGLGELTVDAGLAGDIPLLLGATLVTTAFVFVGNMIANLLYPVVDPRVRKGGDYAI